MNGASSDMSFEAYKKLTPDERDFFVFNQLCKLDIISATMAENEKTFAKKWAETAVKSGIYIIIAGFITTVMYYIGWHPTQ